MATVGAPPMTSWRSQEEEGSFGWALCTCCYHSTLWVVPGVLISHEEWLGLYQISDWSLEKGICGMYRVQSELVVCSECVSIASSCGCEAAVLAI